MRLLMRDLRRSERKLGFPFCCWVQFSQSPVLVGLDGEFGGGD